MPLLEQSPVIVRTKQAAQPNIRSSMPKENIPSIRVTQYHGGGGSGTNSTTGGDSGLERYKFDQIRVILGAAV